MISVIIPVYRNAASALTLIQLLGEQTLPVNCPLEIIAVDDGSEDDTSDVLAKAATSALRVVSLPRNRGRAVARNIGAELAQGAWLAFIDCDCRPTDNHFLSLHIANLSRGRVASCGPIAGQGTGFWKRYQDEASRRRQKQHERGLTYAGTTANLSVLTDAFREAGGFDEGYRCYGFEDRDLLIRLAQLGTIGWCRDAVVQHIDRLTLRGVLGKMREAGGPSAARFSHDHPDAYRALGFASIDARIHGWLRPLSSLVGPLVKRADSLDRLLGSPWLPYPLAAKATKAMGALAFLQGTMPPRRE